MSYDKILTRLEAAKDAYDAVHLAARRAGEGVQGNPAFNEVSEEYCLAWDSAGEIWETAQTAEDNGMLGKAHKLWALLAPFDDEAATRLEALL